MSGWAIAYLVWMAVGFGSALARWVSDEGWIRLNWWDLFLGPAVTLFLLYKAGLFS